MYVVGQSDRPTESEVEAAYLYNFGKFVRWQRPPESTTFDICIIGKDPFGAALEHTVAGERIDGKSIVTRNILTPPEIARCNILFVSRSEAGRLATLLPAAKRSSVLTVSDIPDFATRGGMIELVNLDGRIRFKVNVSAVNDAGLVVSSELLKVAIRVLGVNPAQETRP